MPPGDVGWLWRLYASTGARNGLQPRIASMFATPVASRTLKGASNGTERAFRHSPYRNVRGEAGIAAWGEKSLPARRRSDDHSDSHPRQLYLTGSTSDLYRAR